MYESRTPTSREDHCDAPNAPCVLNEQIQHSEYLPGMTNLIDERFLGPAAITHPENQMPFWLLARRPARSVPNLFPFSTNQSPARTPEKEDKSDSVGDSSIYSILDAEPEILPPCDPLSLSLAPDNVPANPNPAAPNLSATGRYVVSRGDALLLNIMDCQRTSSDEWMELLQNQAAGDASGTSTDVDGEVSEYDDASESGSFEGMWQSEDEEESPMVVNMLSQRSGTPERP